MNESSELLRKYLSLSEEILSLDFKKDFDRVEQIIMEREEILEKMKAHELSEDDRHNLGNKIIDLDKKILEKFSNEKDGIKEEIERVKEEKREQGKKKQAFDVYGEHKKVDKNVFFDKLK